jgi:hypothetical protein
MEGGDAPSKREHLLRRVHLDLSSSQPTPLVEKRLSSGGPDDLAADELVSRPVLFLALAV